MITFLNANMPNFNLLFGGVVFQLILNTGICYLLQVSLSAFAFLFSELVQYNQTQVDNIAELERRW